MPDNDNDDFQKLFDRSAPRIDVDAVIRRARRRRRPAQIAVGGGATLAVGAIVIGGASLLRTPSVATTADSASAPEAMSSSTSDVARVPASDAAGGTSLGGIKRAPAEKLNLCGGPLAEVAPAASGLVLTTDFPDAAAGTESITGSVTLTNTGDTHVYGSTAASPAITLSQDGITLWHSNGAMIDMAAMVDLAPGESMTYSATLVPVICGVEDDTAEEFRADLPAAPAGEYQVSAAIDLIDAADANELVTGPLQTITLH